MTGGVKVSGGSSNKSCVKPMFQLFLAPSKAKIWQFYSLLQSWTRGRCMSSVYILVQTLVFVLNGSHSRALSCQWSDLGRVDYQPLGQFHEVWELWMYDSLLLPTQWRSWGLRKGFSLDHVVLCQEKELWQVAPWIFLPTLMHLHRSAGASQLVSGFFTKGDNMCIIVELVCPLVEGRRVCHLADV